LLNALAPQTLNAVEASAFSDGHIKKPLHAPTTQFAPGASDLLQAVAPAHFTQVKPELF
jgi:hypothetical protein